MSQNIFKKLIMALHDIKVKVKHFGPLENVEFSLAPLMLFTGNSNMGKSYANYLVYYFFRFMHKGGLYDFIINKVADSENNEIFSFSVPEIEAKLNERVEGFMQAFLGSETLKCDVEYDLSGLKEQTFTFTITPKKAESSNSSLPEVPLEDLNAPIYILKYKDEEVEYRKEPDNFDLAFWVAAYFFEAIYEKLLIRTVLLPPGRGAFVGESYSVKDRVASALKMYDYFFKDYDESVNVPERRREDENSEFYNSAIANLLNGDLISDRGKQYLVLKDGQQIPLTAAASSIKELSPLLYNLKNRSFWQTAFCLEEPEAHLHPKMQVNIADFIACALNRGNVFHITTHSDYFMQRLNQLIKLGDIKDKSQEKFGELCGARQLDEKCYLDRKMVKAYYFHRNNEHKVVVEDMELDENGIPYQTFEDTVKDLQVRENYINDVLYSLNEE